MASRGATISAADMPVRALPVTCSHANAVPVLEDTSETAGRRKRRARSMLSHGGWSSPVMRSSAGARQSGYRHDCPSGCVGDDPATVVAAAGERRIDLVVVGPRRRWRRAGRPVAAVGVRAFGPTADGARIEASKAYTKEIMAAGAVPTARTIVAEDLDAASPRCGSQASGASSRPTVSPPARVSSSRSTHGRGRGGGAGTVSTVGSVTPGRRCSIEEYMEGEELSLLVLCDGNKAVPLHCGADHKAIGEGDTGPNTGGIGRVFTGAGLRPRT